MGIYEKGIISHANKWIKYAFHEVGLSIKLNSNYYNYILDNVGLWSVSVLIDFK